MRSELSSCQPVAEQEFYMEPKTCIYYQFETSLRVLWCKNWGNQFFWNLFRLHTHRNSCFGGWRNPSFHFNMKSEAMATCSAFHLSTSSSIYNTHLPLPFPPSPPPLFPYFFTLDSTALAVFQAFAFSAFRFLFFRRLFSISRFFFGS